MASDGKSPPVRPSDGWKERIIIPTILAGLAGAGYGLLSSRRKSFGGAKLAASYSANLSIVTGCYSGARELARDARASDPDDLINSLIGGVASGAVLGRLQGGQLGAIRYAILFAAAGTTLDFATLKLRPFFHDLRSTAKDKINSFSSWRLPEWSPIQVLDEEAVAAKHAREQKLYAQRALGKIDKEES